MSVLTIPTALRAWDDVGTQEGVGLVQAAIAAARDEALHAGAPRGFRLVPDPADATFASSLIPVAPAPDYREGRVSTYPGEAYPDAVTGGAPCLVVESCPVARWVGGGWLPNEPTNWYRNVRAGERIRIGTAGRWYTVCGPLLDANDEQSVLGGTLTRTFVSPDGSTTVTLPVEYLLLTDGADDDGDGFIDEGWDGVDNDGDGFVDEPDEWEVERWGRVAATDEAYLISRRPVPSGGRRVDLPPGVVARRFGYSNDLLFEPGGRAYLAGKHDAPTRAGIRNHEIPITLVRRGDAAPLATLAIDAKHGGVEARYDVTGP